MVSCNAPGAGGKNNSLEYVTASYDPQYNPQLPRLVRGRQRVAPTGLIARSSTVNDGREAKWLTTAYWTFVAPAGTEITEMTSWRFAEARDQGGDDPNTLQDEGDHWRVEVVDHSNQPIGGIGGPETCGHGGGVPACNIGAPGGTQQTNRVATNQLRWQIGCGGDIVGGCPANFGGYPLATMVVYGARITLQDTSAPSASLAGSLVTPGWHKPSEPVTYSRVRQHRDPQRDAVAGPLTASDSRVCDFTFKVPCSNASGRGLAFPGTLPDGAYPIRLTVTDAAQNAQVVEAPIGVDGTPPRRSPPPARARAAPAGHGHRLGLRRRPDRRARRRRPGFREIPTTFSRGVLRAPLDRGNPRKIDILVSVRDNAGNDITGQPARIRITSVTSQRLRAQVRRAGG